MYACFTYLSEIQFGRHFVAQLVCSDELHGFYKQQCGESFGAYLDYFNLVAVSDRLLITKFDFANVSFTVTANQPAEQQTEHTSANYWIYRRTRGTQRPNASKTAGRQRTGVVGKLLR